MSESRGTLKSSPQLGLSDPKSEHQMAASRLRACLKSPANKALCHARRMARELAFNAGSLLGSRCQLQPVSRAPVRMSAMV